MKSHKLPLENSNWSHIVGWDFISLVTLWILKITEKTRWRLNLFFFFNLLDVYQNLFTFRKFYWDPIEKLERRRRREEWRRRRLKIKISREIVWRAMSNDGDDVEETQPAWKGKRWRFVMWRLFFFLMLLYLLSFSD